MEELELTFLARSLPAELGASPRKEMLDVYVPATSAHPTLRVRRQGDRLEITRKEPVAAGDNSKMLEITIPLRPDEFALLSSVAGKRVAKTRFFYPEGGVTYQVDVFREALSGLVLVDVEFEDEASKASFRMPEWCLAEVTQEQFTAGGMLCGKSYADIEADLARFGYRRIQASV